MNETAIDRLNFKIESRDLQFQSNNEEMDIKKLLVKEDK